jgi:hypothetical protein
MNPSVLILALILAFILLLKAVDNVSMSRNRADVFPVKGVRAGGSPGPGSSPGSWGGAGQARPGRAHGMGLESQLS